jgi:pSer/pThr/pTyr-binding forkhead associated (FHA) protein
MTARVILRIKEGKLGGKTYALHDACGCLIGRGPDCEIRLPNEPAFLTVSRHHCVLDIDLPAIRVRDSGSRNGTYLNGMQIGRPAHWQLPAEVLSGPCFEYDLREGDELKVGDTVFEVDVVGSEDPETETELAAEPVMGKELFACR